MNTKKYEGNYVKAVCTMISRGDISNINDLKEYLKYMNFDSPVRAIYSELNMLLGVETESINPEYYISDFGSEKEYSPIDLILYSCVCNNAFSIQKKELLKEIIKLDSIDFSNVSRTLEFAVSKGNLELFEMLVKLKPNYNTKYSILRNGDFSSILDSCLTIAMCRLTINGESTSRSYPKEIFDYLISLKDEADLSLMKPTKSILECFEEFSGIKPSSDIFNDVKMAVENYKK